MSALRPKLRHTITGQLDPQDEDFVWLYDTFRIARQTVRLHRDAVPLLELFDGETSLREIQAGWMRSGLGLLPSSVLDKIVDTLDEALFLDNDRYQSTLSNFLKQPVRPATCMGCYDSEPAKLRKQIDELFTGPGGPGLPNYYAKPTGKLRGALIPHIDYNRGHVTYGWGFKEVVEQSDAEVFVILGTSHFSTGRYILTRKDFETPLGMVKTDGDYVDRIAASYGENGFDEEVAHFPEHSIELHVVILQHLMQQRGGDFRIVPILVGTFQDVIDRGEEPTESEAIGRMVKTLRKAEAAATGKVCYLISGDLAHIGPKFGDGEPVQSLLLDNSRQRDQSFLARLVEGDRPGLLSLLHQERDARRICGFPPAYTFLAATGETRGKMLHYQQYAESRGFESVSFASVAFFDS
jgi:AmmeMemoRadiSam system protein B